jgi:hypothetical protein
MAELPPRTLNPEPILLRRSRSDAVLPGVPPFRSFWMGGFEGADHVDSRGRPLDMVRANGHAAQFEGDYARAAALGIGTVRESIGWRLAETAPGRFDFARLRIAAAAARRQRVQVLWSFMHYGTPPDVSLLDDALIGRFARYARAVAEVLAPLHDDPPVYNLINEIGFLAWAAGETPLMHPYRRDLLDGAPAGTEGSGYAIKRRLVRAVLAGIEAVRAVDPRARFLHVEPVVHCVAPPGRPDLEPLAARVAGYQWQAWDLIAGRAEPALGGSPEALDLVGVNHYHSGQWEVGTERRLWWHRRDPRRRPLADLLADTWRRYRRPLVVAETGHVGAGRAAWLHDVASGVERARSAGVPVGGICLYPLIDRTDWEDAGQWHHSGLWSVAGNAPNPLRSCSAANATSSPLQGCSANGESADRRAGRRLVSREYADALGAWQGRLPATGREDRPCLLVFAERRWDGLRGRLQQLLPHLADRWRVIVVEPLRALAADEPEPTARRLERAAHAPGVEVLSLRLPAGAACGAAAPAELGAPALQALLESEAIESPCVWFTDAAALPWLGDLEPAAVVYDCQADAGPNGAASVHEAGLLALADLVLTHAPSLHERLGERHPNVHRLPAAVDAGRFDAAALDDDSEEAEAARALHGAIGTPRVGYCGRIDARIDLGLVAALAARRPEMHVVMVGPVDPALVADLPRAPNLHWLDAVPWTALPHLVAGWDAGLLPCAGQSSAPCVPVQVLEYLAAGKPVVASARPDLGRLFGSCVRTVAAGDAGRFAEACAQAVAEPAVERAMRARRVRAMLAPLSWRRQAERVERLLRETLRQRPARSLYASPGVEHGTKTCVETR